MLRSHSIRTIQELSGKQEDRMEPQSLLEVIEILVDFRNICARRSALLCKAARGRDLSNMLHSLERVLPTSEMPELVNELDSVLLKHPTCLQQNHAGNRKNNGGFFKAAMSQSCQRATN